jgi:hypothetical protein
LAGNPPWTLGWIKTLIGKLFQAQAEEDPVPAPT